MLSKPELYSFNQFVKSINALTTTLATSMRRRPENDVVFSLSYFTWSTMIIVSSGYDQSVCFADRLPCEWLVIGDSRNPLVRLHCCMRLSLSTGQQFLRSLFSCNINFSPREISAFNLSSHGHFEF